MNYQFEDRKIFPNSRISIGIERNTNVFYISCPFITSNRMVDYEKYFSITEDEYSFFLSDEVAAKEFGSKCLTGQMDSRLIYPKN